MATKKALLIGLNYKNTAYELQGCMNDVGAMRKFLIESKYKYPAENVRCLCDDLCADFQVAKLATKANIIEGFKWMVDGCKRGDKLVLYFSSHGEQVKDKNADESDGMDEAIRCMNDEFLLDDEIWSNLISKIPAGAQLVCFFDCCHSGTISDLKYSYIYTPNTSNIFTMSIEKSLEVKGNIIAYSGCYDSQTSGDGSFEGKMITLEDGSKEFNWGTKRGAFSYYFLQTINECRCNIEYPDLLKAVYTKLTNNGYSQQPEFSCSKPQLFTGKFAL